MFCLSKSRKQKENLGKPKPESVKYKQIMKASHPTNTILQKITIRLAPEGILPGLDKLKAVRDSKPPSTVQEIRQFTGSYNFFQSVHP
jgi:hypothetical protein